jgi:hypothetical protein
LLLETRLIIDLNQGPGGYQPSPHGTTGGVRRDYGGIVRKRTSKKRGAD